MPTTRLGLGGPRRGGSSRIRSRPVSVSVAGTWTPIGGATLFAVVADDSDATYMQSSVGTPSDTCTLVFPAGTPLEGEITLAIRYRAAP